MNRSEKKSHSWGEAISAFWHPQVVTMLFLGFSAGIPILLIFSSLSLWLREAGVARATVTFFSWAALGYSFKFVWAPLVDRLPIPFLTKTFGRRRSWMLTAQTGIITAICLMAFTDPSRGNHQLTLMAISAVLLGFSSATQDIVIDAYRIESADSEFQAMMASTYIAGYRVAMIFAGAGALYLADFFGSSKTSYNYNAWQWTYCIMSASMLIGVATTFIISEPEINTDNRANHSTGSYLRFLLLFVLAVSGFILTFYFSAEIAAGIKNSLSGFLGNKYLAGFITEAMKLVSASIVAYAVARLSILAGLVDGSVVQETYIDPIQDFFRRYGHALAWLLLSLIGLYRISDIVLGVISNVFYQDLGFSKTEIATVVKFFGVSMTIAGGFIGGLLSIRYSVIRILFLGAVLSAVTNLLFMLIAVTGNNIYVLYLVISADNLSAGIAGAAFVAFLSSLTDIKFTAMQYAIFSSLMTLIPKITGGYSGTIVDSLGYPTFFLITALFGLPVLVLIWLAGKHLSLKEKNHA